MTEMAPTLTQQPPIAIKILDGGEALIHKAENIFMMREQWGKPFAALGNFFTTQENSSQGVFNESKLADMEPRDLKEILHFFGVQTVNELALNSHSYSSQLANTDHTFFQYTISAHGREAVFNTHLGSLEMTAKQANSERRITSIFKNELEKRVITDKRTIRSISQSPVRARPEEVVRITMGRGQNDESKGKVIVTCQDGDFRTLNHPGIWGQSDQSLKQLLISKSP